MNPPEETTPIPSFVPRLAPIGASWQSPTFEQGARAAGPQSVSLASGQLEAFRWRAPILVRFDAIRRIDGGHRATAESLARVAAAVHQVGGAVLGTIEDFAAVSLRDAPRRIEPIYFDSMPIRESLSSADAVELQLGDWNSLAHGREGPSSLRGIRIAWPLDVADMANLRKKLELLRRMVADSAPVGLAVPMSELCGMSDPSWRWLTELDIDFLTLRTPAASLGPNHAALPYFRGDPIRWSHQIRTLLSEAGKEKVAVVVDHAWDDGFQAGWSMLAGAMLVGVGSYLERKSERIADALSLFLEQLRATIEYP